MAKRKKSSNASTNTSKPSLSKESVPNIAALQPLDFGELLSKRFHGSSNIRGVQYQILYFCMRAFDLFHIDAPDSLLGEGLEDVDFRSVSLGNEYVQVKHLGRPMNWSIFGGIVTSFRDVLIADSSARLRVVSNANLSEELRLLDRATRAEQNLPVRIQSKLSQLLGVDFPVSPEDFVSRVYFEQISEPQLHQRLEAAAVEHFGVMTNNSALYIQALFGELLSRSGNRVELKRLDLEEVRASVEVMIAAGAVNPAVRDGYIQHLTFAVEAHSDDYYEGRGARPGDIASCLDVLRPKMMAQITGVLERYPVCIIVTSSGQGKSTLAYRYCHDHHLPQTTYTLKVCETESDVGQICMFLRSQLRARLPLLVLIDNLGFRTRLWQRVATEMTGKSVSFLVTAREEDWFRYAGQTSGFSWEVVRPHLELADAKQLFAALSERGLVVAGITSPEAAYERVQERRLLIEYVYLLTHGHLLNERLEEQVAMLRQNGGDPGKLEALRLVSVAHHFGVRIRAEQLARFAGFREDPQQGLLALEHEYIVCSEGFCEGLHPVRSEHLMSILHGIIPVESTLEKLMGWMEPVDLETFVGSALADPRIETDRLLEALIERCVNSEPNVSVIAARACYYAEEQRYYLSHQAIFDQAYHEGGDHKVHMLAAYTVPCGSIRPLESLAETMPEAKSASDDFMRLSSQFQPRVPTQRMEHRLLAGVLQRVDNAQLSADLSVLTDILHWAYYAAVPRQMLDDVLSRSQWQNTIFDLSLESAASLALALSRVYPEEYAAWYKKERQRILSYFKWRSQTLSVSEEGSAVRIEFAVNWVPGAPSPNEQSVSRIKDLSRLLPNYETYCSRGIHLLGENQITGYDETEKNIARENIWQEIDSLKNGDWIRLCQSKYVADSLTMWLTKWQEIRRRGMILVEHLTEVYDRFYREQAVSQHRNKAVIRSLDELQQDFSRLPLLPTSLASMEKQRLSKLISNWQSNFSNFVRQYAEHQPRNAQNRYSQLMRVNLKNALTDLPDLSEALATVALIVGKETVAAINSQQELAAYQRLADFFDYWFEGGQRFLPHPNRAILGWRREQQTEFLEEVRRCLQPLEEAGLKFTFPSRWLIEFPLIFICLGVEVQDIFTVEENVIKIAQSLDEVTSQFTYLQIVPTIGGRQYQRKIWRISRDSIRTLAEGKQPSGMWLFPVEPPESISDVLPEVRVDPLPELDLLEEFQNCLGSMVSHTRLLALASRKLQLSDEFEGRLFEQMSAEVSDQKDQVWQVMQTSIQALEAFGTETGCRQEWQELVQRCHELAVQARSDLSASLLPLKVDEKLQWLWMTYFNKAYLQPH